MIPLPKAILDFPWKLFRRFLASQALLGLGTLALATLAAQVDKPRTAILLALCAACLGFSVWNGRKLIVPLGILIRKARSGEASPDESFESEQPGEWLELETALDRIRSDLKGKSDALEREREELGIMMAAISDAILAIGRSGEPLFFNSRFALLFGDRELASSGRRLGEIFRVPEILEVFHSALRDGEGRETAVELRVRNDPAPRHFSVSVSPLRREAGETYGAVGIFHDLTELKRSERIRIEFVANASHELRTPVTAIKGFADTLRDDLARGDHGSAQACLEPILRNVDRLATLVNDLLDLSSLESLEQDELARSELPTREITERVLAQLEPRRRERRLEVSTEYEAETVTAHPARLEQVLTNLLENAFKYCPPESRVRVRWERRRSSILLRVQDNGPGIPVEAQPRLFERFYRVDQARSRELGGTGLGLSIVKHIMQKHGGTVSVISEAGRGAEFICQFPTE